MPLIKSKPHLRSIWWFSLVHNGLLSYCMLHYVKYPTYLQVPLYIDDIPHNISDLDIFL